MTDRTRPDASAWMGEAGVPWNVLLVVAASVPTDLDQVSLAGAQACREHGWPVAERLVVTGRPEQVLDELAVYDPPAPVSFGLDDTGAVIVRGHHAFVDGQGLLALGSQVTGSSMRSLARGVDTDRPSVGAVRAIASRVLEIALRPSRHPTGSGVSSSDSREVRARRSVPGRVTTAALIHAAARATADWNDRHGAASRRISVAVGVALAAADPGAGGDQSAFLRLRDVERASLDDVRRELATAPLQFGGTTSSVGAQALGGLVRLLARLLSARLGSSLVVSHLGTVEGDGVRSLDFYPLAGGGSGLALGAATCGGVTSVTLRARPGRYTVADLEGLLELVVTRLR